MHGIPTSIEKYNEEFATEQTEVIDGPTIIICKGCDGNAHTFLEAKQVSAGFARGMNSMTVECRPIALNVSGTA